MPRRFSNVPDHLREPHEVRDPGLLEHLLRRDRHRDPLRPGQRHAVDRLAAAERTRSASEGLQL